MKIVFNDEGELECENIIVMGDMLSVDEIYDIAVADIKEIKA